MSFKRNMIQVYKYQNVKYDVDTTKLFSIDQRELHQYTWSSFETDKILLKIKCLEKLEWFARKSSPGTNFEYF